MLIHGLFAPDLQKIQCQHYFPPCSSYLNHTSFQTPKSQKVKIISLGRENFIFNDFSNKVLEAQKA